MSGSSLPCIVTDFITDQLFLTSVPATNHNGMAEHRVTWRLQY
jgi:hypothetical protein